MVALGALQAATHLFPDETWLAAVGQALADKKALLPINEQAFAAGAHEVRRAEEVVA
jgi:2-oxoisovalerate ferredoxin oxidoreductase beta subunit